MFEREIKFIYDFNLNKVSKLGPYFTFEQLSKLDLHPAILNYISAEIDYIIFEDRQKLLRDSIFDYSGEKIAYYFSLINDEIKKTKRLSFEYISKLILHASSFTINYLVRPKWTLKKFIYDEGEHRTSGEIKQILNYVYYYNYLKKILISYINSKKILSLNLQEFEELLDKIDKIGVETNLNNILSTALNSMADFFNIGELQKNKIPLQAIELFLEEKNLEQHLRRLRIAFGEDSTIKCSINDIQKEFNAILTEEKQLEEAERPKPETIEEPIESIDEIKIKEPEENIYEEDSFEEDIIELENTEVNIEEELNQESEDIQKSEELESENLSEAEKNEEEIQITYKPQKFRIRVDKDNEIEPIDESEEEIENQEGDEEQQDESTAQEEEVTISTKFFDNKNLIKDEPEELSNEEDEFEKEKNKIEEEADNHDTLESIFKIADETIYSEEKSYEPDLNETIKKNLSEENKKKTKSININELLEDKEITKIIETIFDYDIEDFSNILELISNSNSIEEANQIIDNALLNRNLSSNSKEAEQFKSIISEYFKSSQ
ncbi:hypothetical protein VJY32_11935 [Ignavibacteria bacterium 4148-Me]|uniref:hypothetical protein n=1 Tax=Rosettibacter primus TaxID=3111523 RepID=UPI00336C15BC